jgi:hypothetical protein
MKTCKFIRYGQHNVGRVIAKSNPDYYTHSVIKQLEKNDRHFIYHVRLLSRMKRYFKKFLNNGRIY